jgi:hypothetical protein
VSTCGVDETATTTEPDSLSQPEPRSEPVYDAGTRCEPTTKHTPSVPFTTNQNDTEAVHAFPQMATKMHTYVDLPPVYIPYILP